MESFLDLQADGDVAPANFERAYKFAKIGGKVVGDSIRFMGVLNKQAAISLQRDRMEARRMRASDDES